jgi:4-alpha-glucanotransferase
VSDHLSLRGIRDNYEKFCFENSYWLEDYAFFEVLKAEFRDKVWNEWPAEIRDRNPEAIKRFAERFGNKIATEKFLQFVFFSQWAALKDYCNGKGIQIIGDVPIYTSYQSADVWAHPELFKLDNDKRPTFVSGVPPDYFSKTGQLWGNPVYNWDNLQETGFKWWIRRIEHNFRLFDAVRIDHFRGFIGYWEVPAGEKTAENGRWVNAPGTEFFTEMLASLPGAQIIAEDLGMITADVRELMRQFNFPGMRPLLFAFGRDLPNSSYAPHNHIQNCLVYTGTHDNNTVRGWFETEASNEDKRRLFRYLGREIAASDIHREFIRLAMMSVADTVILPMQDILGLGADARMNVPSTTAGNWEWRLRPGQFTFGVAEELRDVTEIYGRLSRKPDAVTPAP